MSIVGTRPPLISETNLYEPRHKARLVRLGVINKRWQESTSQNTIVAEK